MNIDTPITLVDSDQQTQSFAAIDRVIAYIRQHPRETFLIYTTKESYQTIRQQVFKEENREDYASLWRIRGWKGQMSGWSELDDLNEMRDSVFERIAEREERLRYGGETYSSNGEPSPHNTP